jgi:hypothetical protein
VKFSDSILRLAQGEETQKVHEKELNKNHNHEVIKRKTDVVTRFFYSDFGYEWYKWYKSHFIDIRTLDLEFDEFHTILLLLCLPLWKLFHDKVDDTPISFMTLRYIVISLMSLLMYMYCLMSFVLKCFILMKRR